MKLENLKPKNGARDKDRFRVGRGMAQGRGKQAGKGQSGQNKRGGTRPGFEGGQNPWFRRLPKFGFKNINHIEFQTVSLGRINDKYKDGDKVDFESLFKNKLIRKKNMYVKVLSSGKITKKIHLHINSISKKAQVEIEKIGGSVTII